VARDLDFSVVLFRVRTRKATDVQEIIGIIWPPSDRGGHNLNESSARARNDWTTVVSSKL
jgi:hypothetical protein